MSPAAEHLELRREDADARGLALTMFDHPLFVEAGAGTGKTTTLVARVVAWCVGPGWREAEERVRETSTADGQRGRDARIAESVVGGVLAITFTEAAAAEMEERIRDALRTLESGEWPRGMSEHAEQLSALGIEPRAARTRASRLSAALEGRMVMTIHAWCLALLSEHPLELGLAPELRVDADGTQSEAVVREILETAIERAFASAPDPDWLVLARRSVGPAQLESALHALMQRGVRSDDLDRGPFTSERITRLCNELGQSAAEFVEIALPLMEKVKGVPKVQAVLALIERTSDAVPAHAVTSIADLQPVCDVLREAWDSASCKYLSSWATGEFGVKIGKALGERASEVRSKARELWTHVDRFRRLDPELSESARRVLGSLLATIQATLHARGVATFSDLLRDARDLLCGHPEVCAGVRRRTRQLLVDEFQDTDPVQCDLVRALALDAIPAAHGIPLPGLFVVGDPKQSIYAWRSADLAAYERFQRELEAAGGVFRRLSVNYRSTPAILREVERTIEPVMIEESGIQPAFEPLVAHAKVGGDPVEYWVSWELDLTAENRLARTKSNRATEIEARWLAAELLRQHESGVEWQEMAILLRTATPLETYLQALRERGIPFDVAGDKSYYRRREIIDAASLVRCVVDPLDRLSLLTALRSSVIGVPDAALIPLWSTGFPAAMSALGVADSVARDGDAQAVRDDDSSPDLSEARASVRRALAIVPSHVPGLERIRGWEESLFDAVEKIGWLRRSYARDPLDVFVERLRTLFLNEATEAARHLGSWRVANLERFFRHLARALTSDAGDPHDVLRALDRALREERDAEEARPKTAHSSAVQVMTIHKSKGLDFAHVYVASTHRESQPDRMPDVDLVRIDGRTEFVLFGAPSPDYGDVHARRGQHAAAERVRTLYVAMTRAEDRLVLLGAWPEAVDRKPVQACKTHRELLEWSTAEDLPRRLIEVADRSDGRVETDHALYLLPPSLAENVKSELERETEPGIEPGTEIDARAVEADALRLRGQSLAAVERMARVFATSVSNANETRAPASDGRLRGARGTPLEPRIETLRRPNLAALAGSAVHRALEDFDWNADVEPEVARRRSALRATIERSPSISESELSDALHVAEKVFDRFREGALFAKLVSLRDHIVVRELSLLSLPSTDSPAVGYVSGAIDLVYRDPTTHELVIVDYKTDAVRTRDEAQEHASKYAAQASAYPRMLRESLALERDPRFELWFLQADCVIACESRLDTPSALTE